jgi:hypothetical protein
MPYNEFWFAPTTDTPDGDGSPSDPFQCGSQSAFDAKMRSFGDDVVIHLYPGAYETKGWSDTYDGTGWRAKKGWRILGGGG